MQLRRRGDSTHGSVRVSPLMGPVGHDEQHANGRSCPHGRDRPPTPASPAVVVEALPVAWRGSGVARLGPMHAPFFPTHPPTPSFPPHRTSVRCLAAFCRQAAAAGTAPRPWPLAGAPQSPARTHGAARGRRNVDRRARAATRRHALPRAPTRRRPPPPPAARMANRQGRRRAWPPPRLPPTSAPPQGRWQHPRGLLWQGRHSSPPASAPLSTRPPRRCAAPPPTLHAEPPPTPEAAGAPLATRRQGRPCGGRGGRAAARRLHNVDGRARCHHHRPNVGSREARCGDRSRCGGSVGTHWRTRGHRPSRRADALPPTRRRPAPNLRSAGAAAQGHPTGRPPTRRPQGCAAFFQRPSLPRQPRRWPATPRSLPPPPPPVASWKVPNRGGDSAQRVRKKKIKGDGHCAMVVPSKAGEAPVKPNAIWANKTQKCASLLGMDSPLFGATTIPEGGKGGGGGGER